MKAMMKQKAVILLSILLGLLFFGFASTQLFAKAESVEKEENGAYILNAVPIAEEVGVATLFMATNGDVKFEFDLLKGIENGYFGFAFGTGNSLSSLNGEYMGLSRTGKLISNGVTKPEDSLRFIAGNRYKFEISKSVLTISRHAYGVYSKSVSYEKIYSTKLKTNSSAFGIFVQSDSQESAYVLLDNITVTNAKGTVYENSFNDPYTPLSGMANSHSNDACYNNLYKGATYTVVFTDGNGKTVKIVEVCEYNYVYFDKVPPVEGKVLKGWSEDTNKVLKDMIVVPVYGEPEPELPPKQEEENNGGNSGGGCGSSISMLGLGVCALGVAVFLFKGKKEA